MFVYNDIQRCMHERGIKMGSISLAVPNAYSIIKKVAIEYNKDLNQLMSNPHFKQQLQKYITQKEAETKPGRPKH